MRTSIMAASTMMRVRALVVALAIALVIPATAQNQSSPAIPAGPWQLAGSYAPINTVQAESRAFATGKLFRALSSRWLTEGLAMICSVFTVNRRARRYGNNSEQRTETPQFQAAQQTRQSRREF